LLESLSGDEKAVLDIILSGLDYPQIREKSGMEISSIYRLARRIRSKILESRDAAPVHQEQKADSIGEARSSYPLRGTLIFYNDPTAPAGEDDWNAMK